MQVLSVHRSVLLIGIIISLAIPFAVIKPAQAMTDQTPAPGNPVPPNIYIPYISGVSQPTPPGQTSAVRAVRVQYTDYAKSQTEAPAIEAHLRAANVNLVGLSAGRVEWTYLDWKDHPELVASSIKDSGTDILAADSNRYSQFAQINVVIDVFSPNYILAHPDKAAINALGQRNPNLVGTMELVDGQYGQLLIQLVTYIASNYPDVDSISLTELSYRLDGYGPSELASYQAYSGNKDWPRQPNGQIEIDNSSIGNWRSHVMDVYLDKLVAICHAHGKKFFMDVQLSWNNLSNVANEDGTNYDLMLQHIDKLIVWGYYYLENYPPEFLQTAASFLSRYGSDHVIMSIGMWGPNNTSMPADLLARGIQASIRGGLTEIWITPSIMLDDNSWNVIQQAWAGPP
jgi:hypothetical protein